MARRSTPTIWRHSASRPARSTFERVDTEPGFVRLTAAFGESRDLILNFSNPYLYLDTAVIEARGLDRAAVERAVADELERLPGIAHAIPSSALRAGAVPRGKIQDAVLANFHPDRSGDIYIVFEPHWFIADFDGLHVSLRAWLALDL